LKTDIKNHKAGISELENPTETPLPAAAVNANSDASSTMLGARPYVQNQFNLDERWLQKIGKISPISDRHCYLILQSYEYRRAFPDGE
jgi:hypothetical protein